VWRALLTLLLAVVVHVPSAAAAEPTRHWPVVVGGQAAISLGELERLTRSLQQVLVDRDTAREAALASLVHREKLRLELRRRGLRARGRDDNALEIAAARAIAGRLGDAGAFLRRFAAFEQRWRTSVRCSRYWSIIGECTGQPPDCLWAGATEVCSHTPDPPERPFWSVSLWPPRFGESEEDSYPLERRLRRRLRNVSALRGRLGEILNEGTISVFALDEGAAALVAREAHVLRLQSVRGRRSSARG
jgi:hypothetical protein